MESFLLSNKVCGPYVSLFLSDTYIWEVYMARLVVKNGHQKHMCHREVEKPYAWVRLGVDWLFFQLLNIFVKNSVYFLNTEYYIEHQVSIESV